MAGPGYHLRTDGLVLASAALSAVFGVAAIVLRDSATVRPRTAVIAGVVILLLAALQVAIVLT